MPLATVQFKAASISKATTMNVILPEGRGPFGVLYLLHGLSDDYSIWCRRTSIERHAESKRLIVVMPDGHRSFYVNDPRPGGCAYEDHIVTDVVGFVDRTFRTIPRRGARAIAGLSMGGYGAMMLAMKHPDKFSIACSHSGVFPFAHIPINDRPDINAVAAVLNKRQHDVFALSRRLAKGRRRLAIRFDCGADDFLIEASRIFHRHLDRLGVKHEYAEHPGSHGWDYWDAHINETLAFVMRNLKK